MLDPDVAVIAPTCHLATRSRYAAPPLEKSAPLLPRVAAGDPAATRECIARYGRLVWSLARRFCGSQEDAEDAAQEVFVELWKSAVRFDASMGSEVTFVGVITRRRLIDHRRRMKRAPATELLTDSIPTEADVPPELGAEAALAARAVARLRPEQREVIMLTACHGLSHEEVASRTGMPLGTVKAHSRRGLIAVRELLSDSGSADPRTPETALEERS